MKKHSILLLIAILVSPLAWAQSNPKNKTKKAPALQSSIFFETGKYDLSDSAKAVVASMIDSLKKFSKFQIFIKGNTDNVGDSLVNLRLSMARSNATKAFFVLSGVDSTMITANSLGENQPIASNETEEGKRKNRRVDIYINYTRIPPDTLWSIWQKCGSRFANPAKEYCIDPSRDTVLAGPKGSLFMVPSGAFSGVAKKSKKCIQIFIKEDFKMSDMIADRLTTTSGDQLLSTDGMVYFMAKSGGVELTLKPKKKIGILIPRSEEFPDKTQLFHGERQSDELSAINWVAEKKAYLGHFGDENIQNWADIEGKAPARCRLFFCKIFKAVGLKKDKMDPLAGDCPKGDTACASIQKNVLGNMGFDFDKGKDKLGMVMAGRNWRAMVNEKLDESKLTTDISVWAFAATTKLGWTNFDQFYYYRGEKLSLNVDVKSAENIDMYLVFQKEHMILGQVTEGKDFCKDKILPKGLDAKLVVMKYEKNQAYYSIQDITTGNGDVHVEFIAATPEEIKAAFKLLDK